METATIEAPSLAQAMQAQVQYEQGQQETPQSAPKPQQTPQEKSPQQEQEVTSQEVKVTTETPQTGKKWEQLGKKTEPTTEKQLEVEEEYPDEAPKAQNAWTKIKRDLKELQAQRSQWEGDRTGWSAREQEYQAKLKEATERASKVNEADLQELQRFREEQAIYNIEKTETFQTKVTQPWNEGNATLQEVSEYTKIPVDKFKEALVEPNTLVRNSKIAKLLKTAQMTDPISGDESELDAGEVASLTSQISEAGKKLHDATLNNKQLREEAALKGEQRSIQEQAAKLKAEQESKEVFSRGMNEMSTNMQVQLKDLIDAGALDAEVFKTIAHESLPTDPMDQIYALHASHMLIPMAQKLREALAKVETLENERKERMAARPGTKVIPGNGNSNGRTVSLQEAMRAEMQSQGMAH